MGSKGSCFDVGAIEESIHIGDNLSYWVFSQSSG